jgi:hypothetical protein
MCKSIVEEVTHVFGTEWYMTSTVTATNTADIPSYKRDRAVKGKYFFLLLTGKNFDG